MKNNKENEELQSRREFFKEAAKKALPVIGAIALAGSPIIANATINNSMGCGRGSCQSLCENTCTLTCASNCRTGCKVSCQTTCKGHCDNGCYGSCNNTCYRSCRSSNG